MIGILRQPDFRLFWLGETTSKLGTSASAVAMPLVAVTTLHAGPFEVGLLTALTWLPWLVVGLPAGAWVDRLPRRPVLVGCDLVSAALFLAAPVAAWLGLLTLAQLLGTALVAGVLAVFAATAYQVYLPSLVAPADLAEGNAKLHGSESAAQVAGPGVAGLLAALGGAVTALLADAVSFLVSAACLARIRRTEAPPPAVAARPRLRSQIADGLRFVARDPYLRVLTAFGAASNLALTGYQALLVVYLVREVGVGAGTVGLLLSLGSCGGVLGALLARPLGRRAGTAHGILLAELAAGPCALLIPLTTPGPGLALLVAGMLGVGTGVVASNVLTATFRLRRTPPELLGRVTATTRVINYSMMPLGAVLAGALGSGLGLRPTMWVLTAGVGAAALILLAGPLKRARDLPTGPAGSRPAGPGYQASGSASRKNPPDGPPAGSVAAQTTPTALCSTGRAPIDSAPG